MLQLWVIPLKQTKTVIKACQAFLDPEESERALRFVTEELQNNYIVAHGAMRQILSNYLKVIPSSLQFQVGQRGKPGREGVYFNLSHTRDWAILAVNKHCEVGVDIESQQRPADVMSLAKRFFSEMEYQKLIELETNELKLKHFYKIWTAKEATIKCTGEGLYRELDSFLVSEDDQGRWFVAPLKGGKNNIFVPLDGLNLEVIELTLGKIPHVVSVVMSAKIQPIKRQFWSLP